MKKVNVTVTISEHFAHTEELESLITEFKGYADKEDEARGTLAYHYHKQACKVLSTIKERFNANIHQGVDCVIVWSDA